VEQLVAESTGKSGRGIVPVVDEAPGAVAGYGPDRLFVEIQVEGAEDAGLSAFTAALAAEGHPVIRISMAGPHALGQEFFRWELAVASASMILGIDPYDQPDVELAKELARREMAKVPDPRPSGPAPGVLASDGSGLSAAVAAWRAQVRPGDYVAVQAYVAPNVASASALSDLRRALLEGTHAATTLGYGPRFLHSTGQLHKGGPNSGLYLQIVDRPSPDLEVPGVGYSFGRLIQAQSLGDYQALLQKGRRVLRIDLSGDVAGGLARLTEAVRG